MTIIRWRRVVVERLTQTDRSKVYIEDITRWREDMNFMFEWQELDLTSDILFLPREHKIYIFELTRNVLFII